MHRTVLLLLIMPAVAAAQSGSPVQIGYTEPGRHFGFTFTPPTGDGWTQDKWGSGNLRMDWNAGSTSNTRMIEAYTIRAEAGLVPLPDYIEQIKRTLLREYGNTPAVTMDQLEVVPHAQGAHCARIHMRLQLRQPAEDGQSQWAEQYTLSCLSARHDDVGYELRYYHRYVDDQRDAALEADAEAVFASVVINEG